MSLPSLPDVPRERRRTATVVAVAALGLLCVVALVIGLRGLFAAPEGATTTPSARGGASSLPTTGANESGSASPSTAGQTAPAADLLGFSSPSGNIRCEISSAGARCDISSHTWKPTAKPASCESDWGQGLVVTAQGAGFVCASDSAAGGSALAYGASVSRGDFRCLSAKDGMTCTGAGHRFSVARASYSLS